MPRYEVLVAIRVTEKSPSQAAACAEVIVPHSRAVWVCPLDDKGNGIDEYPVAGYCDVCEMPLCENYRVGEFAPTLCVKCEGAKPDDADVGNGRWLGYVAWLILAAGIVTGIFYKAGR